MTLMFEVPEYYIKLPCSGKEIKVRPFLVKEEKLLLMAIESKDTQEIIRTTKQVVQQCILTEGVDVNQLPFFTVDYLYICLRAKSIGEAVDIEFQCNAEVGEGEMCNHHFPAKIDVANVVVNGLDNPKTIDITPQTKLLMKYPTYSVMKTIEDAPTKIDKKVSLIGSCIKSIHQGNKVHTPGKDMTPGEVRQFIENMTQQAFKRCEEFIDNLPTFYVAAEADCPKCGYHHRIQYTDFDTFFF